jgi:hypothetical protein
MRTTFLAFLDLIMFNAVKLPNVQFWLFSCYSVLKIIIESTGNDSHIFMNDINKPWTVTDVQRKDEAYLLVMLVCLAGACDC